jgi:hypothetical protein
MNEFYVGHIAQEFKLKIEEDQELILAVRRNRLKELQECGSRSGSCASTAFHGVGSTEDHESRRVRRIDPCGAPESLEGTPRVSIKI